MTRAAHRGYHPAETTDADLVRATLDGDSTAFAELVNRHSRPCIRYATRMLDSREDAEDVAQETWLRAHRALARYDGRTAFRTWLMSILINRCRTALLHRRRRTARVVFDDAAVGRAHGDAHANAADLRLTIERALAQLEPGQREAFLLKHVEPLSYDEMAVVAGAGVSALKMRVQRACERLQLLIEDDRHAR